MRATPLLLALLALSPSLAMAQEEALPNLAAVKAPVFTEGDTWAYLDTVFGRDDRGNATTTEVNLTIRVLALDHWEGVPTYRLGTASVEERPAQPGDPRPVSVTKFRNQTLWVRRDNHAVVHIEEVEDTNTLAGRSFKQLIHERRNTTFHQPMDLYQFPIVGAGAGSTGDEWLVVRNSTTVSNTTYVTTGTPTSWGPERTSNISGASAVAWLRQDRIRTGAGTLDVVVLQGQSGNTTVFDFFAPSAGNLARREVLNQRGERIEILQLVAYSFAQPPDLAPRAPPGLPAWAPLGVLALAGVASGVAWLAWKRRPGQGAPGAPGEEARAPEPPPPEPAPPEPEPGPSGEEPVEERR